jgi:hypothetical protein
MKKAFILAISIAVLFAFTTAGCKQEAKGGDATDQVKNEEDVDLEESEEEAPTQASPLKQASGDIEDLTISIDYGSPAVKGRVIWGELEGYGKVWRAGANETTSIEFSSDVIVNGNPLPAGKYGFFLIPIDGEAWVAIFNEEWSQELHGSWGAFGYKQEKDVLRIDVTPEWVKESLERLEYTVNDTGFTFAWEKARIKFEIIPK